MQYTKMQGAGNDFIILRDDNGILTREKCGVLARKLCMRRLAIGADGMMVVRPAENGGDFSMWFYNCDGTAGEMCGNGARCIARYGYENGLSGEIQRIETTAGLVIGERIDARNYRVRLNDPTTIDLHRPVTVDGVTYDCAYLELGDPGLPHAIVRSEAFFSMTDEERKHLGAAIRRASVFPKGANVTFCRLIGEDRVQAVTFERGVEDFTLACGTGCGSTAAALHLLGFTSSAVDIEMPGGTLSVVLTAENGTVRDLFLTGPTAVVSTGEIGKDIL